MTDKEKIEILDTLRDTEITKHTATTYDHGLAEAVRYTLIMALSQQLGVTYRYDVKPALGRFSRFN